MTISRLPLSPNLEQIRRQAKDLLKAYLASDPDAIGRIEQHHHKAAQTHSAVAPAVLKLADAQLVVAREYGFTGWTKLKQQVLLLAAVAAMDSGNIAALGALLAQNPELIRTRGVGRDYYDGGYFSGATLLHHVAGNPYRGPLPPNIVAVAHHLLDAGADPLAKTLAGADTLGLVLTSRQASESGAAPGLIDLLVRAGVPLDVSDGETLTSSLLQNGLGAAEELIRRGARIDLRAAAGFGRLDLIAGFFNADGSLKAGAISSPERFSSDQAVIEEAMLFAMRRKQRAAAHLLIDHGARGDTLITAGGEKARTSLHEAAVNGDFEIVRRLVENGARTDVRDAMFNGTPAGWAEHAGHVEIMDYLMDIDRKSKKTSALIKEDT